MNKKNKQTKKSKRRNKSFRNSINNTLYQYSSKTQTLGVGTTTIRVTRFYNLVPTDSVADFIIDIIDDAVSSPEFTRIADDYTYCKLQMVTITVSPRTWASSSMGYLKINWYNSDPEDVRYDDNSKLIPTNIVKPKIYRVKPPNVLLPLGAKFINYKEWQICNFIKNTSMPGCLKATTDIPFSFQLETRWAFKGLNSIAPSSKQLIVKPAKIHKDEIDEVIYNLKDLGKKIDEIEEENEEEEKNDEDKEINKVKEEQGNQELDNKKKRTKDKEDKEKIKKKQK